MRSDVLKPKGKAILLGNEAIVRGALEAGVGYGAAYPGTPSSEIGMTFGDIAKPTKTYFEFCPNEKVAAESGAGAAFSGVRSLVCFKHFGFNVASDSILPMAYHGVKAGMIIVCADDPGCHSSGQSEQDSRFFAKMGHMPLLEPANPQECKDFAKYGFKLSEKYKIPVIIRITTRVAHASGVVKLGKLVKGKTKSVFKKGLGNRTMPPKLLEVHAELNQKLETMKKEKHNLNMVKSGKGKLGVIANGVSFHYVEEAMQELGVKLPVLKIGLSWPFPNQLVKKFIKKLDKVMVVEELEPIMEKEVVLAAKEVNPKLKIIGKNHLPGVCELNQEIVLCELAKVLKKKVKKLKKIEFKLPRRLPTFCPGCPHRASFWAIKQVVPKETIFGGDVGCYILGIFPPTQMSDFVLAMGASEGVSHGIAKSTNQKPIAFVGDSTFFHAGIPGLVNSVFNKSNMMIVALDNRWTAMTGHQPNPSTGMTAMGDPTKALKIEKIGKACGVDNVIVSNAFNIKDTSTKSKQLYATKSTSLLVSKGECRLQFMRHAKRQGRKVPISWVDPDKCKKCYICVEKFACPAIQKDAQARACIDKSLCWGCGVCAQVCPFNAISVKQR